MMVERELKSFGIVTSKEVHVDVEISNDISSPNSSFWDYGKGQVSVIGILYKNKATLFFKDKDDESFKKEVVAFLDALPQPFFSFNNSMERGCILNSFGKVYKYEETKIFKGRGWGVQRFFEVLKKNFSVKCPEDPFQGDGRLAITCWNKGDKDSVVEHCFSDIVKQYWILHYKDWFLKNYEIGDDGWVIGEKNG